jgi:hypothetical protein
MSGVGLGEGSGKGVGAEGVGAAGALDVSTLDTDDVGVARGVAVGSEEVSAPSPPLHAARANANTNDATIVIKNLLE